MNPTQYLLKFNDDLTEFQSKEGFAENYFLYLGIEMQTFHSEYMGEWVPMTEVKVNIHYIVRFYDDNFTEKFHIEYYFNNENELKFQISYRKNLPKPIKETHLEFFSKFLNTLK